MYDKSNDLPGNGPVHPLKALTPAEFMALGGKAVVYVKPMTGAALSEMTGNSDFEDATSSSSWSRPTARRCSSPTARTPWSSG